ncbi:S41 family peptidase [Anaerophilus nitritogenes]|uniref:S41 family peptidase n=1 Tax=Anaerophilus nitritogenes TaxID=2498136 RepID=UPI0013EDD729|nr:S41 family peptidase [Anaerophilus nitritogenes]
MKKFNKAKSKILEELKKSKDKFGKISSIDFQKIIINNLTFIKDGHFGINALQPLRKTYAFMNKEESILKNNSIFYIKEGNDPINYIKPSIDEKGKIIYKIVCLKESTNNSCDINITIKDKEEIEKKINLKKIASSPSLLKNKAYSFKEVEGIPVFKVSSFGKHLNLEKLSEDGLKYSDKNIAILDLRGNTGGLHTPGLKWIGNFTNNNMNNVSMLKHINASLINEVAKKRVLKMAVDVDKNKIEEAVFEVDNNLRKKFDIMGWCKISIPEFEKFKNDKVIIVLFDKDTISAGEAMISHLNYMENVIFIGTNSYGALNVTSPAGNILPNTKTRVFAGLELDIEPDFVWRDGIGYFPDFWVEPEDALDRIIKFVNNYIKH